jgi:hypothetical protein
MTKEHHLEDQEIAAAVAGLPLTEGASDHLQVCEHCSQQVVQLAGLIGRRGRKLADGAPDWDRQREQILARLDEAPVVRSGTGLRWSRPLLAAAAAAVAAFGLSVAELPRPASEARGKSGMAVEEVLAEVDAVLDDDTLPGFEAIDPGLDDPGALVNGTT